MAHYAILNDNNIVTQVIVGHDEGGDIDWELYYGTITGKTCKRTSYNTRSNKHLLDGTPFRKNYAGIGHSYDSVRDAFLPPKPFNSWVLEETTYQWQAPIPHPDEHIDHDAEFYLWDEESLSWIKRTY
jgi:hypothetical protein